MPDVMIDNGVLQIISKLKASSYLKRRLSSHALVDNSAKTPKISLCVVSFRHDHLRCLGKARVISISVKRRGIKLHVLRIEGKPALSNAEKCERREAHVLR